MVISRSGKVLVTLVSRSNRVVVMVVFQGWKCG